MTGDVGALPAAKALSHINLAIYGSHPDVIVPFTFKDLLSLEIIRHAHLKRIVLVVLGVVTTLFEVPEEDVSASVHFTLLCGDGDVVLSCSHIYDAVSFFISKEPPIDLVEMLLVCIPVDV